MLQGRKFYVSPSDKMSIGQNRLNKLNNSPKITQFIKMKENLRLLINFLPPAILSSVPCGFVDGTMIMTMITLT